MDEKQTPALLKGYYIVKHTFFHNNFKSVTVKSVISWIISVN